jgi:hypothetical protein
MAEVRSNRWLVERWFHREMIRREFSSVPWSSTTLVEEAVLTHRLGELSLDNAFALIEGHSANTIGRLCNGDLY